MQAYASRLKIEFQVIDADQNLRDEIDMRRRVIARAAADQVNPGEVVLIDGGPIANYLAEALLQAQRDHGHHQFRCRCLTSCAKQPRDRAHLDRGRVPPQQPDAGRADRRGARCASCGRTSCS